MVGDHTVVDILVAIGIAVRRMSRRLDQGFEQVGVIVIVAALQQRANTLKPHAGVDGLHIQRTHRTVFELFVLHENDVPNLNETVAIFLWRTGRSAPDVVAVVIEDFGARTARAGWPHLPEVIRGRDTDDPILRHTAFFPDLKRFVIGVINGGQQTRFIDAEFFGDEFPGKRNGLFLEVVPKGKVTQHLKECVVARRVADVVQIVMLAARSDTFLCRGGTHVVALFDTGKAVLELHHARVCEHQGGVVARNQWRGRDNGMPIALEIVQKC